MFCKLSVSSVRR